MPDCIQPKYIPRDYSDCLSALEVKGWEVTHQRDLVEYHTKRLDLLLSNPDIEATKLSVPKYRTTLKRAQGRLIHKVCEHNWLKEFLLTLPNPTK
jgi:hypothetical protein